LVESPEIYRVVVEYIILIIEVIVGIFVAGIVIITLVNLFRSLLSKLRKRQQEQVHIRHAVTRMLRGLLIVLDFLIAADLLETILEPTLEETAVLALIVVLRILLSWSLSKEIEMGTKEEFKP
jgi:uncharacterized membrane protein